MLSLTFLLLSDLDEAHHLVDQAPRGQGHRQRSTRMGPRPWRHLLEEEGFLSRKETADVADAPSALS